MKREKEKESESNLELFGGGNGLHVQRNAEVIFVLHDESVSGRE